MTETRPPYLTQVRADEQSDQPLEAPDEYITLRRAAELCGVAFHTLRVQANRNHLRTAAPKYARDRFTTRRWLHEYLTTRDSSRGGKARELPSWYVAP